MKRALLVLLAAIGGFIIFVVVFALIDLNRVKNGDEIIFPLHEFSIDEDDGAWKLSGPIYTFTGCDLSSHTFHFGDVDVTCVRINDDSEVVE